jgi:hypothetical protein
LEILLVLGLVSQSVEKTDQKTAEVWDSMTAEELVDLLDVQLVDMKVQC